MEKKWRYSLVAIVILVITGFVYIKFFHHSEHAGKEHGGKEHAGDAKGGYTAKQIKAAMMKHIHSQEKQGVFEIQDPKNNNKVIRLRFVKIHDPVRKIEGKGFFACTDFQVDGVKTKKLYDLDFWLDPKGEVLTVTKSTIHKNPVLEDGKWIKKARYTFINDKPVEVK